MGGWGSLFDCQRKNFIDCQKVLLPASLICGTMVFFFCDTIETLEC